MNYYLSLAIKNLLILTGCTCGKYMKLRVHDIECILYEGYPGYQKVMENRLQTVIFADCLQRFSRMPLGAGLYVSYNIR